MSKYHIGEAEYIQIKKRLNIITGLINNPVGGSGLNINELCRLSYIAKKSS